MKGQIDYFEAEKIAAINRKNGRKPTIPSLVNKNTKLAELNLNWREKDLPEKERTKHVHKLHPYLGKFIPQLVEVFIRKYFKKDQIILDPFCGSGTTLVQAAELGLNSIGIDISEFNVLLSKVKTQYYDTEKLKNEIFDILELTRKRIYALGENPQLDIESGFERPAIICKNEYLKKWFAPKALQELLIYKNVFETGNYKYKDLYKIILSRSARSARLTTHFNLDFPKEPQLEPYWCYKHSRLCSPVKESYKFLRRYSLDTLKRIELFNKVRNKSYSKVLHDDSRFVQIREYDGLITSPPYVGLIDYHKQHAYAYNLLGLSSREEDEIGPASNGSSKSAKEIYVKSIVEVLKNVCSYIKPDGKIIIIANDSSNLYPQIIEMANLKVESIVERHVNRRTGRRKNAFYESVFILKPAKS